MKIKLSYRITDPKKQYADKDFWNKKEAKLYLENEKNRNKNDGYDEYWNNYKWILKTVITITF